MGRAQFHFFGLPIQIRDEVAGPTKLPGDAGLWFSWVCCRLHVFGVVPLDFGPDLPHDFSAYFATLTDCFRHEVRHNLVYFLFQRR